MGHQAITWPSVESDLSRHTASLSHNELMFLVLCTQIINSIYRICVAEIRGMVFWCQRSVDTGVPGHILRKAIKIQTLIHSMHICYCCGHWGHTGGVISPEVCQQCCWVLPNKQYRPAKPLSHLHRLVPYWCRADSRFVPSQWEMALLCNDVSHWLGASLESALWCIHKWPLNAVYIGEQ